MLDIFGCLQAVVSVVMAWWSYKVFWPQFKKQKRIENLASLAYKALDALTEVEELIKQLYFLEQVDLPTEHKFYTQRHLDTEFKLSYAIHQLRNILLLLSRNEDLKINREINQLTQWIKKLERIIDHDIFPKRGFVSINLFKELKFLDDNSFRVPQFESLRSLLQEINQIQ